MVARANEQTRVRPRGRPKATEGLDTRAELLRVARELFSTHGYAATSMTDITARAGVTVPVIYQRFGSKAGLYVAVAEDVYTRSLAVLREITEPEGSFHEAVDALLAGFAQVFELDRTMGTMVATVLLDVERHDELAAALRPSLRALRAYIDDLVALAPPELAPDTQARNDLSRALVALLGGLMSYSALLHSADDYERTVAAMRRLILPTT